MLEEIFAPANRDEDCRRISRMLMPVENAVEQYLWDGEYGEAVGCFCRWWIRCASILSRMNIGAGSMIHIGRGMMRTGAGRCCGEA